MSAQIGMLSNDHGYFEDGDDFDYVCGEFWLDGNILVDFDGCTELPEKVVQLMCERGIDLDQINTY